MFKKVVQYITLCRSLLKELHQTTGVSMPFLWVDSIWALLRHGILIKQYTHGNVYKLPRIMMKGVLSQKRLEKVIRKYNETSSIHLLSNKDEFNRCFSKWVKRKWLTSKDMTLQQFEDLYYNNERLFVKPLDAQEGVGIKSINVNQEECHQVYEELKRDNVIIEEAIKQHHLMNFGNSAVNTVRVITCMDRQGVPHILRAALRVGVGDSLVDNFSAGGALYDIDVDTGIIDAKGIGHNYEEIFFHLGTDIYMLGYQLPNWNILVNEVVEAAKTLSSCRFIGWDVAITETGIELIEGNHNPGLFTMESLGKPCSYVDAIHYFEM